MKKIIVDKNDGIAEVIDAILNEPDKDISLVIPKGSTLGKSLTNFNLLKREAKSAGRHVVIESVDDGILAFAKETGFESSHPLWKGVRGAGGVSDIVSRKDREMPIEDEVEVPRGRKLEVSDDDDEKDDDEPEEKPAKQERPLSSNRRHKKAESIMTEDDDQEEMLHEESEEEDRETEASSRRFFGPRAAYGDGDDDDDDSSPRSRGRGKKIFGVIGVLIVLALIGAYIVSVFFNRADIIVNFQQQPWSYQNNFTAETSATTSDISTNVLGAQVFSDNKNVTETFPASATSTVSLKAQGMITIYNQYSDKPQELVATTRFLTPSGQIFRITSNVTVPGEQTVGGKLTPSSITAPIAADQPGPAGNIGPVAHLSIPGFDNNAAMEAGFYGVINASTTGGYIGEKAVPTAADITNAKASTTAALQTALQGGFSGSYPNNFKILDGATNVSVSKITVNSTTDSNGNFTVFGEATLQAIGFDESALKTYLLSLAQAQEQNSVFKSLTLNYSDVTANFTTGQVSFALTAQGSLEPSFSTSDFASTVAGDSITTARAAIAALPNLADGQISVWPSWLWSIPTNPNKIHITVN